MVRTGHAVAGGLLLLALVSAAGAASDFSLRIDGKVLRKASGKLVLSLSEFEIRGRKEVRLRNRKTGETRIYPLSSVYEDISYTEPLSRDEYGSFVDDDWIPFVDWVLPDTIEDLNARLRDIHEYQNSLRKGLGAALLEESAPGTKVSSRITLNKIEKFHRVAATFAREILRRARERDEINPFIYPVRVQVGFNPFVSPASGAGHSPLEQVREVMYWEVHRLLTQQFGVDESIVDFVFDAPPTVRLFAPIGERPAGPQEEDFFPTVTLSAESMDAAVYLLRQGFDERVKKMVRLRMFKDPFIVERPAVDRLVNEGTVAGIVGKRVAVTFAPPFVKPNEILFVGLDAEGKEEIPVVLEASKPVEGYTLSAELPDDLIQKIRPGMPVRRR